MSPAEVSTLMWYKQARANLYNYLARLEADRLALTARGVDMRVTEQMIIEVKRRLTDLDRLLPTQFE
jgi:hypothetical protein